MPKKLHRKLLLTGKKQGLKGERLDAYVYGTMRKIEAKADGKAKRKTNN